MLSFLLSEWGRPAFGGGTHMKRVTILALSFWAVTFTHSSAMAHEANSSKGNAFYHCSYDCSLKVCQRLKKTVTDLDVEACAQLLRTDTKSHSSDASS
jgi:hypothetical protein